ncbi:MAG: hypothetical protein PPP55_03625 [Halorubrum sp.]
MTDDKIRDIPKLQEAVSQAKSLDRLSRALPYLKPILNAAGVDVGQVGDILEDEDVQEAIEEIEQLVEVPDRFVDELGDCGWVIHENLSLEVASEAVELAESGDIEAAEDHLVSYYDRKIIDVNLVRMKSLESFKPRYMLARKAAKDYEEERYHACVPVVLALLDGLVQQAHIDEFGEPQNASAEDTGLEAWDSLAGHSKSLNQFLEIFRKQRVKTRTDRIEKPYRNGIMHGVDLGYDNELVAAKSWNALFAVGEWARKAEQGELEPPDEDEAPSLLESISESIETERRIQKLRQISEEWEPRPVEVGSDLAENGAPGDYPEDSPERAFVEFLEFWAEKNYGRMFEYLSYPSSWEAGPGRVRDTFGDHELKYWRLIEIDHSASAAADITVEYEIDWKGEHREKIKEIRLVRQNEEGKAAPPEFEEGDWKITTHTVLRSP